MYGNLFVRRTGHESLREFAAAVYQLLGVTKVSERNSSNYSGETYFVGTALAMDLTVALADEDGFEDYAFWISLKRNGPRVQDDSYLDRCGDVIARVLAMNGYEVCGALSWGASGTRRVKYVRQPRAGEADAIEACVEDM
jgi:hypothetical protein